MPRDASGADRSSMVGRGYRVLLMVLFVLLGASLPGCIPGIPVRIRRVDPEGDARAALREAEERFARGDIVGAERRYRDALRGGALGREEKLLLTAHIGYQDILLRTGRGPALVGEYRRLLEEHPRQACFHYLAARVDPDPHRRLEILQAALEFDAGLRPVVALFVHQLVASGQTEEALRIISGWLAESPRDPELALLIGDLKLQAGRPRDALDSYRATMRHVPGDPRAHVRAFDLAARLGDRPAMEDILQQARTHLAGPNLRLIEGMSAFHHNQLAVAGDILEEVFRSDPKSLAARLYFARHLGRRDPGRALEILEGVRIGAEENPREWVSRAWVLRGDFHARAGALHLARGAYKEAASISPGMVEPLRKLADIHFLEGDREGAVRMFQEVPMAIPWKAVYRVAPPVPAAAGERYRAARVRLSSPDAQERRGALRDILGGKEPWWGPLLLAALGDPEEANRVFAVRGLRSAPSDVWLPFRREILGDESAKVRGEGMSLLGRLGDVEARTLLVDGLADPDLYVREIALATLTEATGGDTLGYDPAAALAARAEAVKRWREWVARTGESGR